MITHLILHHSASPKETTTSANISNWHKKRNWGTLLNSIYAQKSSLNSYSQYAYIIEEDGKLIQCRRDNEIGWHSGDWNMNQKSIGICLCGNFEKEKPNDEQIFRLRDLLKELRAKYGIPTENILGHREVKPTDCPGKNIKMDFIRGLAKKLQEDNYAGIRNELILSLDALLNATKTVLEKAKKL